MSKNAERLLTHAGTTRPLREWAVLLGYTTRSFENKLREKGEGAFTRSMTRSASGRLGSKTMRQVIRVDASRWMSNHQMALA